MFKNETEIFRDIIKMDAVVTETNPQNTISIDGLGRRFELKKLLQLICKHTELFIYVCKKNTFIQEVHQQWKNQHLQLKKLQENSSFRNLPSEHL